MGKVLGKKRILSFQGIRAYAIILIFISHCNYLWNVNGINRLSYLGAFGVSLFMLMSGFLTGYHYLNDEQEIPKARSFLFRRLKKIYNLHVLTMFLVLPLSIGGRSIIFLIRLLLNLTLMQSWMPWSYFSFNSVAWYLSEFVFFTSVTPFLIRFYLKRPGNMLFSNPLFRIIAFWSFQIIWCFLTGRSAYAHWLVYAFPPVRMVDFLIGIEVFRFYSENKRMYILPDHMFSFGVISCGFLCILSFFYGNKIFYGTHELFSVGVWTLPSCLILCSAAWIDENYKFASLLLKNKIALFFGDFSMEFFLFHQIVIRYLTIAIQEFAVNIELQYIYIYISAFFLSVLASVLWKILVAQIHNRRITGEHQRSRH